MNLESIQAAINAPTTVLVASGAIVVLAAIGAFFPLRNGNGQHAGAGPGAVDVWRVRNSLSAETPDNAETPDSAERTSGPGQPESSCRPDIPEPAAAEFPSYTTEISDHQLYSYPDLYSCRGLFSPRITAEAFDTITVQKLDPPDIHAEESRPEPDALSEPAWISALPQRILAPSPGRVVLPLLPTDFERLLAQGIESATEPHPYQGKHRLHAVEEFPIPHVLAARAA